MGEILRAVLEQSAVFSRPRFYAARLVVPAPPPTGVTRSTVTTFDKLGYFLLTSFYVGSTLGGTLGTTGFGLTSFSNNMQLQDVQTGKYYYDSHGSFGGPPGNIVGSFSTSQVELSEYPLFEPGERIRWIYTLNVAGTVLQQNYIDICYSGIEFLMPGGPTNGAASS
jgi:hypothetical protein